MSIEKKVQRRMSTSFHLEPPLLRRLRIAAIERGLKQQDAVAEALECWLSAGASVPARADNKLPEEMSGSFPAATRGAYATADDILMVLRHQEDKAQFFDQRLNSLEGETKDRLDRLEKLAGYFRHVRRRRSSGAALE